jgi:heptose I phosphotransferase
MIFSWWRRLWGHEAQFHCRADWPAWTGVDWREHIMNVVLTDDFHAKQGRSTGRWQLHRQGQTLSVYLKRHYRLPRWRGLLATVWPGGHWSPAMEEFTHLEWARRQGVPVPEPLAAGEFIGPWGRLRSFLAVKELTGMLPLHQAIPRAADYLPSARFRRWKQGLIAEIARLSRLLHDRRRFHKDLYLCHFYVASEDIGRLSDWAGRVRMIDFHRLGHHPATAIFWRAKDLAQLLFSSDVAGVGIRDRLHFWRCYLGGERRSLVVWLLRRWVLFRWRLYRRHADRSRAAPPSKGVASLTPDLRLLTSANGRRS